MLSARLRACACLLVVGAFAGALAVAEAPAARVRAAGCSAAVDHLSTSVASVRAGAGVKVVVSARDAADRVVSKFACAAAWSELSGSLSPAAPSPFVSGVSSTHAVISKPFRQDVLTVTAAGRTVKSAPFNVYGTLDHIVVKVGTPVTAAAKFALSARAFDDVGNFLNTYSGPATWSDTSGKLTGAPGTFSGGTAATADALISVPFTGDRASVTSGGVTGRSQSFDVAEPAAPCSAAFQSAWDRASAGKKLTFALGPFGAVTAAKFQISGACRAYKTFSFLGATLDLFTGAAAATGAAGVVSNKNVCVGSANLTTPTAWRLGTVTVAKDRPLCAAIGGSGTPSGKLVASGTPFYSIPGLDGDTSIGFTAGGATLAFAGTFSTGAASISAAIDPDATFSGNATLAGVRFMGQTLPVQGRIRGDRTGITSSSVRGMRAGPFGAGDGVTVSNLLLKLGTGALSVAADATLGESSAVATHLAGSVKKLDAWNLAITTPTPAPWTPIAGLTLQPSLAGVLTASKGVISFDAKTGAGTTLADWKPRRGFEVQVQSVEVASTVPSSECSSHVKAGHVWLQLGGPATATVLGARMPFTAVGCADLTSRDLDVELAGGGSSLKLGPSLAIKPSSYALVGTTKNGIEKTTGAGALTGTVAGTAVNRPGSSTVLPDGTLVVGANVDSLIGRWIPGALAGNLYFASAEVSDFDTDSPLGTLELPAGISLALKYTFDSTTGSELRTAFSNLGLPAVPDGVVAQASLDAARNLFDLKIELPLGTGAKPLFAVCPDAASSCGAAQATSLTPKSAYLEIDSDGAFVIGADADLHLPAMIPGGSDSTLETHAELELDLEELTAQVSLFYTGAWNDAFSVPGLTLSKLGIQGGLSFKTAVPVPSIGFIATATHLPDTWASTLGYTQGGPLTIGLNISITNPIVDIEFGEAGGTDVVLRPLAPYGAAVADDLQIRHGQLVLAPFGGFLGGEQFDPGVSFAFEGTVVGISIDAAGSFTTDPAGFSIDTDISAITLPNTSVVLGNPDGTHVHVAVSQLGFAVSFSGGLQFSGFQFGASLSLASDGSMSIDSSLQTTGTFLANAHLTGTFRPLDGEFSLSGTATISVPTGSIDASISADPVSGVSVSFDVSTALGYAHFGGGVSSSGFFLTTSFGFDTSGSATITGIAQIEGAIHVSVTATISSNSGFSAGGQASFNGSGCLYDVFDNQYDLGCSSVNLDSGSISVSGDLRSISFTALGSTFTIPLV